MLIFNFAFLPKIEKITRDTTIVHFLLMFGYKLFSLYFPLFLVANNLSINQVGYSYLLIYLPIALFSPLVGYLNHKINPAILAFSGILGYGVYALGMILISPQDASWGILLFYLWQVLLGVSAALFFTSFRGILMGFPLKQPDRAFGWFYSAPFYAAALAPAFGAFLIWQFSFTGVFIASIIIHIINAFFCLFRLSKPAKTLVDFGFNLSHFKESFLFSFNKIKQKATAFLLIPSFAALLLAGFYGAFFVLFLEQELGWPENTVLLFVALSSLLFTPISLWVIKRLKKEETAKNILQGSIVAGIFIALFGILAPVLNFFMALMIYFGKSIGFLTTSSARSGLFSKRLKDFPEEAGVIDTILPALGVALGALISGFLIDVFGFELLFIFVGFFVIFTSFIGKLLLQKSGLRGLGKDGNTRGESDLTKKK